MSVCVAAGRLVLWAVPINKSGGGERVAQSPAPLSSHKMRTTNIFMSNTAADLRPTRETLNRLSLRSVKSFHVLLRYLQIGTKVKRLIGETFPREGCFLVAVVL